MNELRRFVQIRSPHLKEDEEAMSAGAQKLTESSLAPAGPQYDSYLFSGMALLILGTVLLGFAKTSTASASVHLDGCLEVEAAYYGAPPGWIGRVVRVQWDELYVRLAKSNRASVMRRKHR